MNKDIQDFIDNYKKMVDTYRPKVSADSAALREADEYLVKMADAGKGCADIGSFLALATEQDMMNRFSSVLSKVAMESLKKPAGAAASIPPASDAALGYHKAYEAMADKAKFPETCRVYERVFQIEKESADAGEFSSRMAREGLFVKMATVNLVETFRPLAGQADDISLPVMSFHNRSMLEMAQKATSSIEVEYESQRLLELNRMELAWDTMLNNDLFYTLGNATSSYLMAPTEEHRQEVENASRFVAEFFGVDDEELFRIPRVVDLIDKVILKSLNSGTGGKRYTREEFIAEQRGVVQACLQGKPPVEKGPAPRRSAILWGKAVPLDGVLDALRNPQRPEELGK
ncbi:MAG: hypothetical protein KA369_17620 [Spirochaetes bacterium]|nr:hypothetical protein [Spirochaetota bacterium]